MRVPYDQAMSSRDVAEHPSTAGAAKIAALKVFRDRAYELIDTGIKIETARHEPLLALDFYEKGVTELQKALALPLSPGQPNEELTVIRKNLKATLTMVMERIRTLNSSHNGSSASSAKRSSSATQGFAATLRKSSSTTTSKAKTSPVQKSLRNVDPKLAQMILDEILIDTPNIHWEDIAGLENAKQLLQELVILPLRRPDIFTGLRTPARGVLLFGPPGTGKTMLAKAVATEAQSRFFNISAASLTSKYVGESEKLVRALFAMARDLQPAVIFVDEIDSLLTNRSEGEHEASRRLKTEFLLQFDGLINDPKERLLVLGATNRPQELDDAVRRRFTRRVYIPLPDSTARAALIANLTSSQPTSLTGRDLGKLIELTAGYSSSDIAALAKEAALGPVRELGNRIYTADATTIRPISMADFRSALTMIKASVNLQTIDQFERWNKTYGAG